MPQIRMRGQGNNSKGSGRRETAKITAMVTGKRGNDGGGKKSLGQ